MSEKSDLLELEEQEEQWKEKVIQIRRVAKVVKGGKRMSFRALAVAGNNKGKVGVGLGKANEVSSAIRKSVEEAKKYAIEIPTVGSTIPHEVLGRVSASRVIIKPAAAGRGVIAGGAVRIILELAGVKDAVAKSIGSANAINVAKATLAGLLQLKVEEKEAKIRGKELKIRYIQNVESK